MKKTIICLLLAAYFGSVASAQITSNWVTGDGYFSDPSSWNNGVPVAGDTAILDTGGTFNAMFLAPNQVSTLRVQNGSTVSFLGSESLSTDFAFVEGASALNLRQDAGMDVGVLRVADTSDGSVTVTDQNTLKVTQNAIIGRDFNTTGFMMLNSASNLDASDLTIAQSGNASVSLSQASTGSTGIVRIGHFAGSNGSLSLSESDLIAEELIVGYSGFGNMITNNNSQLDIETMIVGKSANSDGVAMIDGSADVGVTGGLEIGMESGSSGDVNIGDGSISVFAGELVIGNQGVGCLEILTNGVLQSIDATIGMQSGGLGTVDVQEDGTWNCLGNLTVGDDGVGHVNLFGDSTLNVTGSTFIGKSGSGRVSLNNINSRVNLDGDLGLGELDHGELFIDAGFVDVDGSVFCSVNRASTSHLLINGFIASFDCSEDMVVGQSGESHLEVSNFGDLIVNSNLVLAEDHGSVATVDIFSRGDVLVIQDFIVGGIFGGGSATVILNRGELNVLGDTLINSVSSLEINSTDFDCPQLFNAGTLTFKETASLEDVATRILNSSSGQVVFDTLGPMTITEHVENNGVMVIGTAMTFSANHGYSGFGSVVGGGLTRLSGTIRPGNDTTGILEFEGNVFLDNANLLAQINSQSEMDRMDVNGQLMIGESSTLECDFENGFSPIFGETYFLCNIIGSSTGEFGNYSEGDVVRLYDQLAVVISYEGGVSGDDVVLNVVNANGLVTLGDLNLDGSVNLLDVQPFVQRVSSGNYQPEADCNADGSVDLLDVSPFVALLVGN